MLQLLPAAMDPRLVGDDEGTSSSFGGDDEIRRPITEDSVSGGARKMRMIPHLFLIVKVLSPEVESSNIPGFNQKDWFDWMRVKKCTGLSRKSSYRDWMFMGLRLKFKTSIGICSIPVRLPKLDWGASRFSQKLWRLKMKVWLISSMLGLVLQKMKFTTSFCTDLAMRIFKRTALLVMALFYLLIIPHLKGRLILIHVLLPLTLSFY